jgi:hypothetical protein
MDDRNLGSTIKACIVGVGLLFIVVDENNADKVCETGKQEQDPNWE